MFLEKNIFGFELKQVILERAGKKEKG